MNPASYFAALQPGVSFACCDRGAACASTIPPQLARAVRSRQLDYAAGRRAASDAVRQLTGQAAAVGRSAEAAPIWPDGIVGSISHSSGVAVAVAGQATGFAGLGIDVEKPVADPTDIAPVFLSPREIRELNALNDPVAATVAFSAKEALFKALYPTVRHRFGFDAAELVRQGDGHGTIRLLRALSPWTAAHSFDFHWTIWRGLVLTILTAPV